MSPDAPRTTTVPGELRALVERLIVAWRDAPVLEITGTAALQREGAAQRTLVNLTAIGIGRSLGLEIVAEGIETPTQARLSVGIAANHGAAEAFGDLLAWADAAQSTAKRQGNPVALAPGCPGHTRPRRARLTHRRSPTTR
ncbi:MAG: hypothetical protein EA388_02210 [Nitriliruptor sp.]|nr:MAG: hypothetical protein EA388_02210 [Nitriliruptor sp.]